MSQFSDELSAFEQRRLAGAADNEVRRRHAAENLGSFIGLMVERDIPSTGCYKELAGIGAYERIGAGWVISKASQARDRTGSIVLHDGSVYSYREEDGRSAVGHINEPSFVIALADHAGETSPSDPITYGDETGVRNLRFAAHDLGAV